MPNCNQKQCINCSEIFVQDEYVGSIFCTECHPNFCDESESCDNCNTEYCRCFDNPFHPEEYSLHKCPNNCGIKYCYKCIPENCLQNHSFLSIIDGELYCYFKHNCV